jgi:non-ribosomal peptide synthetase component F
MVTLAAFQALLSRYTGTGDIVVGTPVAGRTRTELEDLIGFFVNTLPLRADLSTDPSFAELVEQVRNTTLDGAEHQDLAFEQIVEQVAPARELGRNPIVQVLFNYLGAEAGIKADALALPGLDVTEFDTGTPTTRFDLELHLFEDGQRLTGRVIFSTDLFDQTTISRFAGHYRNLLTAAVHDPSSRVSRIPIMTDEETALIARWNDESETA